jgi:hypothetical protein
MGDAVTPAPRERGWRRLLPALLLFLFVPVVPLLRVFVPIEQTFVLLTPALAACTLVGWWAGGRLTLALIWVAMAVWMLTVRTPGQPAYDALARGWAVLLAASFGLVCLLGARRPFFSRALTATGIALGVALLLRAFATADAPSLQATMETEFARRVDASFAEWNSMANTREWRDFARRNPELVAISDQAERQLRAMPAVTARVFPALLGLESLAALALAWSLYHRVSRARIGLPLAPLREFRFNDQLIWGLIVGITLAVLPTLDALRDVGINLLVFFGALYALRGFGVLTWFLAPGRLVTALLIGLAILAWPLLGVFALGLGLGDTWLDWRSRARPTT